MVWDTNMAASVHKSVIVINSIETRFSRNVFEVVQQTLLEKQALVIEAGYAQSLSFLLILVPSIFNKF